MRIDIPENLWDEWLKIRESKENQSFKDFFISEIEEKLKETPVVFKEDHYKQEEAEIATISFAYNNSEILKLLIDRGSALASGNFDKIKEIETEI